MIIFSVKFQEEIQERRCKNHFLHGMEIFLKSLDYKKVDLLTKIVILVPTKLCRVPFRYLSRVQAGAGFILKSRVWPGFKMSGFGYSARFRVPVASLPERCRYSISGRWNDRLLYL